MVRFPISEDSYEVIVTNLDTDEFPADSLKQRYDMRWGIETSFRKLITSHVVIEKKDRNYEYKINFSVAVHICYEFLLNINIPPDMESLIARYITPIRLGRSRPREMKVKQAISFIYRIA